MSVKAGNCVKTGARVLLAQYGRVVSGDVFAIGDNHLLINYTTNGDSEVWENSHSPDELPPTHAVATTDFLHSSKGVIVVERAFFSGPLVE